MNKKKFLKELDKANKNKTLTPFRINELFNERKSFFNDAKVDDLIKENFKDVVTSMPKGNIDVGINTLYSKASMKEFLEKEGTIKTILDNCEYFDFKSIISDSDIHKQAKKFVNDNFDYHSHI